MDGKSWYHLSFLGVSVVVLSSGCSSVPTERGPGEDQRAGATAPVQANEESDAPGNNISVLAGLRGASGDLVDIGPAVGLEYSHMFSSGLGFETGFSYSKLQKLFTFGVRDFDLNVYELDLGGRYTYPGFWDLLPAFGILPYVGVGAAGLIFDEDYNENSSIRPRNVDDGALGAYLRGGVNFLIVGHWTIGLDVRALATTSRDLDYYGQVAIMTGISF